MRPIVDDENYQRLKSEAEDFESGIGRKLQKYLILKSWWAPNYVSDWWEEYVYLKSPGPLMAKSNIHFTDHIAHPTKKQTARAANVTHLFMEYRKKLDKQEIQPIMGQGMVPLCSTQYER
jgi:carnitine O-palmitoyltransferase 1